MGDLQATGGDLRARGCDLGFAVRYLDLRGFQLAAGVGQGLAVLVQGGTLVVDLSLAVVELGVGVGFGVVELALRFVDDALAAGLLPVVLHGVFDAVDDFVDDAVVFVAEGVLFGGALDGQADGGVDVAGDAAAGGEEHVVGGGGAAQCGGDIAGGVGQVLGVQHLCGDDQLGGELRRGFVIHGLPVRVRIPRFVRVGCSRLLPFVRIPRFVRFSPGLSGVSIRIPRIGQIDSERGRGVGGGDGDGVADAVAGVDEVFLGDGDLAGFGGHPAFLQVGQVEAFHADFGHRDAFVGAGDVGGCALRAFGLDGVDAVDAAQRDDVVVGQAVGGEDLDVVQSLSVVEPVGGQEHVAAAGVDAGEYGDAEQRDNGDGEESLPTAQPGARRVFDIRERNVFHRLFHASTRVFHGMFHTHRNHRPTIRCRRSASDAR